MPCGEGIRTRNVQCKIFLEFSKTVAILPDHACPGPKPPTTEICYAGLCDASASARSNENLFLNSSIATQTKSSKKKNKKQKKLDEEKPQGDIPILVPEASPLVYRRKKHGDELEPLSLTIEKKTSYSWKEVGFTPCSESCLGGKE